MCRFDFVNPVQPQTVRNDVDVPFSVALVWPE